MDEEQGVSGEASGVSAGAEPAMSKNAAKKLAKRQKYEATKLERRAAERLKKKANKRNKWATRHSSDTPDLESETKTGKRKADSEIKRKVFFNAKLVIDCGFEDLMNEKELSSFGQQLMYLYSANRHAQHPFSEIILTGNGEPSCLKYLSEDQHDAVPKVSNVKALAGSAETVQANIHESCIGQAMNGKLRGVWRRWKGVTIYEHGGLERLIRPQVADETSFEGSIPHQGADTPDVDSMQAAGRINVNDVVYLTADTDNVLTSLEEGTTYVIGGIVDKNRYKALCKTKAEHLRIRMAKLPLTPENLDAVEQKLTSSGETASGTYTGRKVLTVNQVVEILLGWTETGDWVEALCKSLPQRKYKKVE